MHPQRMQIIAEAIKYDKLQKVEIESRKNQDKKFKHFVQNTECFFVYFYLLTFGGAWTIGLRRFFIIT